MSTTTTHQRSELADLSAADDATDVDRILEASGNSDALNAAVFSHLMTRINHVGTEEANLSHEICALEDALRRRSDAHVYLVARKAAPPKFDARSHRNEPRPFYLQIAGDNNARRALFEAENIDDEENSRRLRETGLCTKNKHETRKKAKHLKLPVDLHAGGVRERFIDAEAVHFFDANISVDLLRRHARFALKDKVSDVLRGTQVQVVRTSVPFEQWTETRTALRAQITRRAPLAVTQIVASIYEEVVPLGYHALGVTTDDTFHTDDDDQGDATVLFDLYAATLRRHHVELSTSEMNQVNAAASADALASVHQLLADRAFIEVSAVERIVTRAQLDRHFVLSLSSADANDSESVARSAVDTSTD